MGGSKVLFVLMLPFVVYANSTDIFITGVAYTARRCKENDDCVGLINSKCEDGFCICNSSRICRIMPRAIVRQLGENCTSDNECYAEQSGCVNGECVCKSGYVKSINGTCLKEKTGDSCEDSVQCYTKIQFSGCQENRCKCQQHTHELNGSCYRDVELDQNCGSTGECAFVNFAVCVNSKCKCMEKYIASTKGSRCLPVANEYRSPCVDNAQCTELLGSDSECLDGICECKEAYRFKNKTSKCVEDIFLGEICEEHSDCHEPVGDVNRLECVLGECKCKNSYIEKDGYCISSSQPLEYSIIIIIFHGFFSLILLELF